MLQGFNVRRQCNRNQLSDDNGKDILCWTVMVKKSISCRTAIENTPVVLRQWSRHPLLDGTTKTGNPLSVRLAHKDHPGRKVPSRICKS